MTNKQADLVIDLVHVREKVKQFIKENEKIVNDFEKSKELLMQKQKEWQEKENKLTKRKSDR